MSERKLSGTEPSKTRPPSEVKQIVNTHKVIRSLELEIQNIYRSMTGSAKDRFFTFSNKSKGKASATSINPRGALTVSCSRERNAVSVCVC